MSIEAKQAGALFYTMPDDLRDEQIDPLIRHAVRTINASGWVWTAESCQGHPDESENMPWGFNVKPMLRLVVRAERLGDMLSLMARSAKDPDDNLRTAVFEVISHPLRDGWFSVLVYAHAHNVFSRNKGIAFFERFAESLRAAHREEKSL